MSPDHPSSPLARAIFILGLIAVLSACGFHLRGALNISPGMQPVFVSQGEFDVIARELRSSLRANSIALTGDLTGASSAIEVTAVERKRKVLSVDANNSVREYEHSLVVDYTITYGQFTDQFRLNLQRDLSYDPAALLAFNIEVEQAYRDMSKQAARSILLRLQAME